MADFILHRKISVDTYQFPKGAFKIYGGGKFYNGFSIGDATNNLSVVNKEGVLKFSRGAANQNEKNSVILGTIPQNNKVSIYIDIASPLPKTMSSNFLIGSSALTNNNPWFKNQIYHTTESENTLQAGGLLSINFQSAFALEAIPNLCAVRALWAL